MQKVGCAGYLCLVLAVCLLTVCILTGCADQYPEGQILSFEDLQVTLPGDFINLNSEASGQDAGFLYGRNTLIVKGMREAKTSLQEMTLEQYTAAIISGNRLSCTPTRSGSGYLFTYEKTVEGTPYTYVTAAYEGSANFWILQFYCPSENLTENQPEIEIIMEGIAPVAP